MSDGVRARARRWVGSLAGLVVVLAGLSVVASPGASAAGDDWGGLGFKIAPHSVVPTEEVFDVQLTYGPWVRHWCVYTVQTFIAKKDAFKPADPNAAANNNASKYSSLYELRTSPNRNFSMLMRQNSSDYISSGNYFSYNSGQVDDKHTDYGSQVAAMVFHDADSWDEPVGGGIYSAGDKAEFERNCAAIKVRWQQAEQDWAPGKAQFLRDFRFDTSCTVKQTGPGGSDLVFDSQSEVENGVGYTQGWTFSDGTTSQAGGVFRAATKPGPFTGVFTIAGGGRTSVATCKAEVKAPELGVGVAIVDDAGTPIPLDAPPTVGDSIHVRVRVSAGPDGVGALSGLRPVEEWLTTNGAVEPVGEPVLPDGPFDLEPGEHRDVVFDYRVTEAGPIGFGAAVQGTDAIGRLVQADGGTRDTVAGIGVEVSTSWPTPPPEEGVEPPPAEFQADNNGDGEVDDLDHVLTVTVKATNLLDVALDDVHAKDDDEAVDFVNDLAGGGAAAIELIPGETYDTHYGDLAPGTSATKTYRYQATEEVDADANVSVRATTADDRVVPGFGTAEAKLGSHLALQVRMDSEDRPTTSGQVVRLHGSLTNLLEDKTLPSGVVEKARPLAVVLTPITEGNAGNGYVTTQAGGRTPTDSDPVRVAPGATVDIGAILATQRSEISSHARVHYLVRAWEVPDDPAAEPATEIDQSRVQFDEDETSSAEHDTILAPDPVEADGAEECETTQVDAIVSCNLWVGLRDFGYGTIDLAKLTGQGGAIFADATGRVALWSAHQIANTVRALGDDPQARQELITELQVQYQTWVVEGILPPEAIDEVGNAFTGWLNEAQDVVARGDAEAILAYTARAVGSNPDLALAPLTKLRMMNSLRLAAIADAKTAATFAETTEIIAKANQAAAAASQEGILARVAESAAKGENVAEAGVFRGGEDVTDLVQVTEGVLGARPEDLESLLEIARSEKILIAVRSRGAKAAELVKAGLGYLKPMDIKAKSVNAIDTKYLGFRDTSLGKVELVSPPIDFTLAKPGRESEFAAALDDYLAQLKAVHPELAADAALAGEVRARLELRTKEFPKELANFARYGRDGVRIEFGYGEQGLPRSLDVGATEIRAARITPGTLTDSFGTTRSYFQLEMAGPQGGPFKAVTGDLDIVGILNDDRTMITDAAKRLRIYQSLQELVGMQHGDTITWVSAEGQAKLLQDHVPHPDGTTKGIDTLFVAGSDGRMRAGFLEKKFSSFSADVLGTNRPTFQLVTGAPAALVRLGGETQAVLAGYDATWRKLQRTSVLLLPGKIDQFVDGLSPEQVSTFFDRGAAAVRPTGDGGVETYGDGARPALVGRTSLGSAFAARARDATPMTAGRAGDSSPTPPEVQAVLDEAAAAGIDLDQPGVADGQGTAGGSWRRTELSSLLDAGSGTLRMAPITSIAAPTAAGSTSAAETSLARLGMSTASPWFAAGDTVVLDPGGPTEERAVLAGVSPMRFTAPVGSAHPAGTTVLLAPRAATTSGSQPSTPASPQTSPPSPAASTLRARARSTARGRIKVRVTVTSTRSPTGQVMVMLGRKRVAAGVLSGSTLVLRSKRVRPGRKALIVTYLGSSDIAPSSTVARVRVRVAPR